MSLIAVDFDHVLTKPDGAPCAGARTAMNLLRERGHRILIFSCNRTALINEWMRQHDIAYDLIYGATPERIDWIGKPMCALYVGDRAYAFPKDGDWGGEIEKILDRLEEPHDASAAAGA